ncbi:uncharacterized protein LOC123550865, partial [Mercenaria mercenaria]|uniref:uncharacterized protein LOC123550865 n=1 Tax=Mercenaria mercenaria TaxID=6596 RepID=UPI00234F2386
MAEASKPFENNMLLCPNPKCGDIGESKFCKSCGYQRVPIPEASCTGSGSDDNRPASSVDLMRTQGFHETSGAKVSKQRLKTDICRFCECALETGSTFCRTCGKKVQRSGST